MYINFALKNIKATICVLNSLNISFITDNRPHTPIVSCNDFLGIYIFLLNKCYSSE